MTPSCCSYHPADHHQPGPSQTTGTSLIGRVCRQVPHLLPLVLQPQLLRQRDPGVHPGVVGYAGGGGPAGRQIRAEPGQSGGPPPDGGMGRWRERDGRPADAVKSGETGR